MAASSGIYTADDIMLPAIGNPDSAFVTRRFKATLQTMLNQTGAAKFLLGDIIMLAPIPPQVNFVTYKVYVPAVDTSTGVTWDLGDSQVLSGAVTGQTSGTVTLPAVGSTFTLTAAASTSSFTATNGLLSVGSGLLVNYESLSGSTFVNCRTFATGAVIPNGAGIQQCGNTAAYQAASIAGQSSIAGFMTPEFAVGANNAVVTTTPVATGTPTIMPAAYQTGALAVGAYGPTLGNIGPTFYFLLRAHAAVTTMTGTLTTAITGYIQYYYRGF